MKAGWEVRPLGEVCEIIGGGTPSKKVAAYFGGDIPWATVRDMNVETVEATEHTLTQEGLENSSAKLIPSGEVIIATRVGLGKVCFLAQATAINQDLRGVIPKSQKKLDRRYLFYWFKNMADTIIGAGSGATVQGVKLPFVKSLPIPLPPLEEQRRIVALLDEAFEGLNRACENTETNLTNARELFAEISEKVLSEEGRRGELEELVGRVSTGPFGSLLHKSDYVEGGVPLVNPSHIQDGKIIPDNRKTVSPETSVCDHRRASRLAGIAVRRDQPEFDQERSSE